MHTRGNAGADSNTRIGGINMAGPFISKGNEQSVLEAIKAKLDAKANAAHTHQQSDVTGLSDALAGKANATHTHNTSDVTGLDAALGNKANTSDVYTKQQIDTLIDNVNHAKILNLGTVNSGLVEATEATVTEVCNQYVQTNYSRSPTDNDSIIVTLTDKSNDKVMYMYMNESWIDISRNAADVASATEDTAGITKLYNAISTATDGAVTPAAVNTALAGKAPISHTHEIANVNGLQDALDGKAPSTHSHTSANISDFQTQVDARINANVRALTEEEVTQLLSSAGLS